jgi:hypothetical protein
METSDIIMTIAVIIGPIAAIQIQRHLDYKREKLSRKLNIFKTLMSTRETKISLEHVQALNMIDVDFRDDRKVVNAWRSYHDHLHSGDPAKEMSTEKTNDLFTLMLQEMGIVLGYNFDQVMLKRTAYTPVAHGDLEMDQQVIRRNLAEILSGKGVLPVSFTNNISNTSINDKDKKTENKKQQSQ